MLQPSDNFFYRESTSADELFLEQVIAGNLPLLFPRLSFFVKAGSPVSVLVEETVTLTNSANPNADGVYTTLLWTGSIGVGLVKVLDLPTINPVPPLTGKITRRTVVSWEVLGASAELLVGVRGLVDSAIRPDPSLVSLA